MASLPFSLTLPDILELSKPDVQRRGGVFTDLLVRAKDSSVGAIGQIQVKGLILAQNERWRRGLGMQVEREGFRKRPCKVAEGRVMHR